MKYYPETLAELSDDGIKGVEKVKKIIDDFFNTFNGNEALRLNFTRGLDDEWEVAEWEDDTDLFKAKIHNVSNFEWVEYFFGAYLQDQINNEDLECNDSDDTQYLEVVFHKTMDGGNKVHPSSRNIVKASMSYETTYPENKDDTTGWCKLPPNIPKSWINKFKKLNGKRIDDDSISYDGSGDDGAVNFDLDGEVTPMEQLGFTEEQIDKMYNYYNTSDDLSLKEDGIICGYGKTWENEIDEWVYNFANFNNEGCNGKVKTIFHFDEKDNTYELESVSTCYFGCQESVEKEMLVKDFLKTKPRMN